MRILQKMVAVAIALALASSGALAQTAVEKQAAKMHAKLEKIFSDGTRAKLELQDGRKVQGVITELDADTFVLGSDGRSETYRYAEVKKVGRIGPSPNTRMWVALGMVGGLLGLAFLAASQTR